MKTRKKEIFLHVLTVVLLLASLAIGIFSMKIGYIRTVEGGRDLGLSVGYYFAEIFNLDHNISPTVIQPSILDRKEPDSPDIPETEEPEELPAGPENSSGYEQTTDIAKSFAEALVSSNNFISYLNCCGNAIMIVLPFISLFAMLIIIFVMLIKKIYEKPNTDHGKDTLPLRLFKYVSNLIYQPFKKFILYYKDFLCIKSFYVKIAFVVWILNLNIVSIILELFAYVFYFSASMNFTGIGFQLYKLWCDVKFMFTCVPFPFYLIVLGYFVHKMRYERGYCRLENYEKKNRRTFDDLPVVTMFVGKMGTGKDLSSVDIALSKSVKMREDAFRIMQKIDMRFPYFPWIVFEMTIVELRKRHLIYNLYTCRKFVCKIRDLWEKKPSTTNLFGYDFYRYNMDYDDGTKIISLWDALNDYAQAYFLFSENTSFIFSNHAIREDNVLTDSGNLPVWDVDFFRRPSRKSAELSRFSHILDFNMLRPGVKLGENDPYQNLVEFGIFVFSEAGKDRGNQNDYRQLKNLSFDIKSIRNKIKEYEKIDYLGKIGIVEELKNLDNKYINFLKSKKKSDFVTYKEIYSILDYIEENYKDECSPLNDYFNLMLKMFRHMSTVDNVCFACMIMNDQRVESLNADARELCDIITLKSKSARRVVLPFSVYDEMAKDIGLRIFEPLYTKLRVLRGDTTFLIYILKTIISKLINHWERISNKFGVFDISFVREDGKLQDTKEERRPGKIHICTKKDFADRYTSTGFSGYFESRVKKSEYGISDAPTFSGKNATWSEHLATNGHFVSTIAKFMEEEDDPIL